MEFALDDDRWFVRCVESVVTVEMGRYIRKIPSEYWDDARQQAMLKACSVRKNLSCEDERICMGYMKRAVRSALAQFTKDVKSHKKWSYQEAGLHTAEIKSVNTHLSAYANTEELIVDMLDCEQFLDSVSHLLPRGRHRKNLTKEFFRERLSD
jgi:hypothetical protein